MEFGRFSTSVERLPMLCNSRMTEDEVRHSYEEKYPSHTFEKKHPRYILPTQDIFTQAGVEDDFLIYPFDSRHGFSAPTIVKSRASCARSSNAVLLPLDYKHHWGDISTVAERDIPFEDKRKTLLWRGATTGNFKYSPTKPVYSSRFYVPEIPQSDGIDVAFAKIVQLHETNTDKPIPYLEQFLRPSISVQNQLQCRYLLALEGNDVATSLKWMLASNSTVVMPHPTCETWACEKFLEPYVHYVPVRSDLSDIEDVYHWCLDHDDACRDIAQQGRLFISEFQNPEREAALAVSVSRQYQKRVSLTPGRSDFN